MHTYIFEGGKKYRSSTISTFKEYIDNKQNTNKK